MRSRSHRHIVATVARVAVLGFAIAIGPAACGNETPPPRFGGEGPGGSEATALDALPARATFAIRLGLRHMRGTPLAEAIPSLVRDTALAERYGQWVRACRQSPFETFDDVVIGVAEDGFLIAAELRVAPEEAMRCVRETFGAREAMFQERQALRIDGPTPLFAMASGRLLLVGDEASMADSLDMGGRRRPLASCLDADPNSVATGCGSPPPFAPLAPGARDLRFHARSTAGEFSLEATFEFASANEAGALRAQVLAAKKSVAKEAAFVRTAVENIRVEPSGPRATLTLTSGGDGVSQANYLMALGTGLNRALWTTRATALTEEARKNVAAIAEGLRKFAGKPRARGPVFPLAPPEVPEEVPRGVEHTPTAGEFSHPAWGQVGFAMREPHRYQYEIAVSPNRRRATAIARGDLDGNGKTSLFEVSVEAVGTSVVVSPMKIADELE